MVLRGDEIQQYIDSRYIGPTEAAWRLFENPMHEEKPNVTRLALHLPDMQRVYFVPDGLVADLLNKDGILETKLTSFFKCCANDTEARRYTYQEFPNHYVWNSSKKQWTRRKQGFAIGRIYFANPRDGDVFYLRLLLTIVKGPTSFQCLRTVDGVEHATFKAACIALGLLEDDTEWKQCLQEAAVMQTGYQLRRLFGIILLECSPAHPDRLWNMFAQYICDDLAYELTMKFQIESPTNEQVEDYGLLLLEKLLLESGKTLKDFRPMPVSKLNWNEEVVSNRLIWEQRQLNYEGQLADAEANVGRLNKEQLDAYYAVIRSVSNEEGRVFFLSGAAGTGKTFVYNTIANICRSRGHIVIMVASSGIASLLLDGGRTAHSTFKIPLDILETSMCGFTKQCMHAGLFKLTKLIIWDEITMQHRFCIEAVDRTLQDITGISKPFGGITIVLGGDFRQTLPVVPKGIREQIVGASLRRSFLWSCVEVLRLVKNMRLSMEEPENIRFAEYLNYIGSNPEETVVLPTGINYSTNLRDLILSIYPCIDVEGTVTQSWLTERTILSSRNNDVATINNATLDLFPGEPFIYLAADKVVDDENNTPSDSYPTELLNSLDPSGLPPFQLKLKKGTPVMLLRNLAPKDGLCNGTRLMILRCGNRVIEAEILTGSKAGKRVFIPRMTLVPSTAEMPFQMSRRQFPIRPAYAMTINKSQGQSIKYVGLDLRTHVFSHG